VPGDRLLYRHRCAHRLARRGEDGHETVAQVLHLLAVVGAHGLTEEGEVRSPERFGVLLAEPLEEAGRVDEVGEEKGDGAGRRRGGQRGRRRSRRPRRERRVRDLRRRQQRGVLREHGSFQGGELGGRLDPELFDEEVPKLLIGPEGLRLAA